MKAKNINIPHEEFVDYFYYDSDSGDFFTSVARKNPGGFSSKSCDIPKKKIGSDHTDGYIVISHKRRNYLAHRLAYYYMTGNHPEFDIDHINGVKNDNRWCNLRLATRSENRCNCEPSSVNTSGTIGVTFHKLVKKYVAQIKKHGKSYHLGCFEKIEDAIKCRKDAEKVFHGEFLSRDKQKTINE
jgi:hypothetical protein